MGKSGKLVAINDVFIYAFLRDETVRVLRNGRIQTKRDCSGHLRDQWRDLSLKNNDGYQYISYRSKSGRKNLSVHRLVYAAFCGKLDPQLIVNHKDGDRANNMPSNLELATQAKNNEHRFRVLGRKPVIGNCNITQEIADDIRDAYVAGATYGELVDKYKQTKSNISYIINAKIWANGRYKKPIKVRGSAKITEADAAKIKKWHSVGKSSKEIAKLFCLSTRHVRKVIAGTTNT
jgi:Mor family transcriptional regulator